jgi:glyoxylase I family protein
MDSPVRGFSHVQLRVSDIDASAAWWTTALGLTRMTDGPMSGALPLSGNNGRFVVVISGERRDDAGGEVDHLAFSIGDRDALAAWGDHLTAAGIKHDGLVESNEGLSIHLTDPDGLAVELIAP